MGEEEFFLRFPLDAIAALPYCGENRGIVDICRGAEEVAEGGGVERGELGMKRKSG